MLHTLHKITLVFVLMLCMSSYATSQTAVGSITLSGVEQNSGSVWDSGTVVITLNSVSVSVPYGQYSTSASIASALGALISQNCNMPVYARAAGATLNFYQKGSNTITSASITSTSSNTSLFSNNSFLVNGGANWSPPQIVSLSLTEGPPGMGFVITGENFGSTQGTVTIGGVAATIIPGTWTPTSIAVQVPNGLAASSFSYQIVVETPTWEFGAGEPAYFQVDDPFVCN